MARQLALSTISTEEPIMTGWRKRTIMEMAKEAEFELDCVSLEWHKRIEAFAKLVREDERDKWMERAHIMILGEREECAKVCDDLADVHAKMNQWGSHKTADTLADAIRARSGEQK